MKRILVIQFRTNEALLAREAMCLKRELETNFLSLNFVSALDGEFDWDKPEGALAMYDGFVFGGSGDLDFDGNRPVEDEVRIISESLVKKLKPIFQYIFSNDLPTLGICYGHQIIGAHAGVEIKYDEVQKKTCSHQLSFLVDQTKHVIFSGLPDSFYAHYGHKDVLTAVPQGCVLLLQGGNSCQVSALQYKNNIYTVQFHPELTYLDMVERIKNSPGYLPEGVNVEEVFKEDDSSSLILRNFGLWVTNQVVSVEKV